MKYSIITINYNNRDGLKKTIESVINQTCSDFEYIIIDGGSTDGSVDVIKEYANKIDYWVSEPDNGIYNAMNKGIKVAKGEYLNFMNSGDCFYNNRVLKDIYEFNSDIIIGKYIRTDSKKVLGYDKDKITMLNLFKYSFNHQSMFLNRELFKNMYYDENYRIVSDWIFLIENIIFNNCSFINIPIIVVKYDVTGISSNEVDLFRNERNHYLRNRFTERQLEDYIIFSQIDENIIELLFKIKNTTRLRKLCNFIISYVVKLHSFIINK